jgi:hypothetical protein
MTSITRERLLLGLDGIAASLASRPQALALLALGSCGVETDRLDDFSDLDFFIIVEESAKQDFIESLDWLTSGSPIVFAHRNTRDGCKTLDQDGVFCEFAVFHPAELKHIPFAPGRLVWARDGFDAGVLQPQNNHSQTHKQWLCNEAYCNILIGLKRYLRGEKLSAWRCIAVDAGELVCKAVYSREQADAFNPWRRLEMTDPNLATQIQVLLDGQDLRKMVRALLVLLDGLGTPPLALIQQINLHLDQCDAR